MRTIKYIVVHCTAGNQNATIPDIRRVFKEYGWRNAGYHYVVLANGNVHQLEPDCEIANGVQGYNYCSIHIAWAGGHNGTLPTVKQAFALSVAINQLRKRYPAAKVVGHCDLNPQKSCPLIDVHRLPDIVPL